MPGRLSIARVEAGEQIIFVRGSTAVAKLVLLGLVAPKRQFGAMRGMVELGDSFFDPLPEAKLARWDEQRGARIR
jgi:antitoxin (DNA-binding transcriptional repressor) of toxin-antitoxin stability system